MQVDQKEKRAAQPERRGVMEEWFIICVSSSMEPGR